MSASESPEVQAAGAAFSEAAHQIVDRMRAVERSGKFTESHFGTDYRIEVSLVAITSKGESFLGDVSRAGLFRRFQGVK